MRTIADESGRFRVLVVGGGGNVAAFAEGFHEGQTDVLPGTAQIAMRLTKTPASAVARSGPTAEAPPARA